MKVTWRSELPMWLLLAGMFALAAVTWSGAPDRIPVHWNLHQQVDRYGGRVEGLFSLPLVALGIYLLTLFVPRIDPGRANYVAFMGAFNTLRLAMIAFFAAMYLISNLSARGVAVQFFTVMPVLFGALMIVVGNLLGKLRPNWFMGIRTPWTLSSKDAWVRSHRVGGWVCIGAGILFMASGVAGAPWAIMTAAALFAGGQIAVVVYSYLVWRADPDKVPPAGTTPA